MSFLINKLKESILISIIFFISLLIYTFLIKFNLVSTSYSSIKITTYILGLILFFLLGIISALKEKQKGWLAGGSSGIIVITLIIIINLFTHQQVSIWYISKLISFLLISTTGGILGINLVKEK